MDEDHPQEQGGGGSPGRQNPLYLNLLAAIMAYGGRQKVDPFAGAGMLPTAPARAPSLALSVAHPTARYLRGGMIGYRWTRPSDAHAPSVGGGGASTGDGAREMTRTDSFLRGLLTYSAWWLVKRGPLSGGDWEQLLRTSGVEGVGTGPAKLIAIICSPFERYPPGIGVRVPLLCSWRGGRLDRSAPELLDLKDEACVTDLTPLSALRGMHGLRISSGCCRLLRDLSGLPSLKKLIVHDCATPVDLASLELLPMVEEVALIDCLASCLVALHGCIAVKNLHIQDMRGEEGWLKALSEIPHLEFLFLGGLEASDLADLGRRSRLRPTYLCAYERLTGLRTRGCITTLRRLSISASTICSLAGLEMCTALEELSLFRCPGIRHLDSLRLLRSLSHVVVAETGVTSVGGLSGMCSLKTLWLGCHGEQDLSALSTLCSLVEIGICQCPLRSLSCVLQCSSVRNLSLIGCGALDDLGPLGVLSTLVEIVASRSGVRCLNGVQRCHMLERVDLSHCARLCDLGPLGEAPALTEIIASYSGVTLLEGLCMSVSLRRINISFCVGVISIDGLLSVPSLRFVNACGTRVEAGACHVAAGSGETLRRVHFRYAPWMESDISDTDGDGTSSSRTLESTLHILLS